MNNELRSSRSKIKPGYSTYLEVVFKGLPTGQGVVLEVPVQLAGGAPVEAVRDAVAKL